MQELKQSVECVICHQLPTRVCSSGCGHSMCFSCQKYARQVLQMQECPVCRAAFDPQENTALQRVVDIVRELDFSLISQGQVRASQLDTNEVGVQTDGSTFRSGLEAVQCPGGEDVARFVTADGSTTLSISSASEEAICDVFGRPAFLCAECGRYVKAQARERHVSECGGGRRSSFGLATMRSVVAKPVLHSVEKKLVDKAQKKMEKNSEVHRIPKNLGEATMATATKKLRTDLQGFGFSNALLTGMPKAQLVQLHNKFVAKYSALDGETTELFEALRVMICDEILADFGAVRAPSLDYLEEAGKLLQELLPKQSVDMLRLMHAYASKAMNKKKQVRDAAPLVDISSQ